MCSKNNLNLIWQTLSLNCVWSFKAALLLCVRRLTNDEDAANILTAIALWLEVADRYYMVLDQAVIANVIIYSQDLDELWAHLGICCNSWNKIAKRKGYSGSTQSIAHTWQNADYLQCTLA